MMPRINRAWILFLLMLGASLAFAQGPIPVPAPAPLATDGNWARVRTLVSFLITDEGTRKAFANHRSLGESFGSADQFSYFVAPWRARISVPPATRQEALDVGMETLQKADGTTTCVMTYHHREPPNAITIVKTIWLDESLQKLVFMKGFSNIPGDNAERNRRYEREESYQKAVKAMSGARKQ
jgi:hypothetical protein